ncbi:hypothetical protein Bolokhovo_57 [Bacillus phage Bolokhovo]|uniref:Uncharacterized protein n=1 Tax=Bacillus phage Bolokhovo TaxID=2743970 RepID=A0A7D7KHT4_9CAUD|nr:hypothetical protein Bolokhovo_57 [Bacillus phage Bolokhovo]
MSVSKTVIKRGQLTEEAEYFLHDWFRGTHPLDYTFANHAEERLKTRKISKELFWEAFTGRVELIKLCITDSNEPRVIMRSIKKFKGKRITAVFNPTTKRVITVFYIKEIPDPKGKPIEFDVIGFIKRYERRMKRHEQKTKNPA